MPFLIPSQPRFDAPEDDLIDILCEHNFMKSGAEVWASRAPGRLDFMGGNVDYTGGLVLQSVLSEAVWAVVQPRQDDLIHIFNPGAGEFGWDTRFDLRVCDLDINAPGMIRQFFGLDEQSRWISYVLGSLYLLRARYGWGDRGGADLFIASDLPPNKGVSSSAALAVAILRGVAASIEIPLAGVALATAAQWVENVVVGSACGIMDQAAIVLGQRDHLLPLLCQPCEPGPLVPLPPRMRIWGVDSMVPRSTTGTAYEVARAAAFIAYRLICQHENIAFWMDESSPIPRWTDSRWSGYVSNIPLGEFRSKYEGALPEYLSGEEFLADCREHLDPFTVIRPELLYPVRAAVRYAIEESHRVHRVQALLEESTPNTSNETLRRIGQILCESHAAYRECGLGSADCDELVQRALAAGFPGAKMTGGGAGGVVAILGRQGDEDAIYSLAAEYEIGRNATPHIFGVGFDAVETPGVQRLILP